MRVQQSRDYLAELDGRLAAGLARLPERFRTTQLRHVESAQRPDGGFPGRLGGSDLYYTDFALRALAALDPRGQSPVWPGAASYVRRRGCQASDVVQCFCLLDAERVLAARGQAVWPDREAANAALAAVLDGFRTAHGGYAKPTCGCTGLYHTFLGTLCEALLGLPHPDPDARALFVRWRHGPDGGFADLGCVSGRGDVDGGTNQTAAAVATLSLLGALDDTARGRAAAFLVAIQRPDGGFPAYHDSPEADLLSTHTALVTLGELDAVGRVRRGGLARFVKSLARPDGGFGATPSDEGHDVEYTCYGLATLGLLSLQAQRERP